MHPQTRLAAQPVTEHSTNVMLVPLNTLIAYSCSVKIPVEYTLISPEEITVGMKWVGLLFLCFYEQQIKVCN